MKTILQKTANILFVNAQQINKTEVLGGITGITIFFYNYSRFSKIENYNSFADYLLDILIENLDKMDLLELINFSWGIEYLIINNFVEGDSNEILEEIDERIVSYSESSNSKDDSEVFWGLFLLSRIKNDNIKKRLKAKYSKIIIENFKKIFETRKEHSLSYLNSMLFSFMEIYFLNLLELEKNKIVYNRLLSVIFNSLLKNSFDQNDLELLTCLLKKYNMPEREKIENIISEKTNLSTRNSIEYIIKKGWQNLLYFEDGIQENGDIKLAEAFIDKIILDISVDNLTVNKGIAGLGMVLIN